MGNSQDHRLDSPRLISPASQVQQHPSLVNSQGRAFFMIKLIFNDDRGNKHIVTCRNWESAMTRLKVLVRLHGWMKFLNDPITKELIYD
jgi:hypothetical protein